LLNATRYIKFYYILLKVISDARQEVEGTFHGEVIIMTVKVKVLYNIHHHFLQFKVT
jgi:hypothetical protein